MYDKNFIYKLFLLPEPIKIKPEKEPEEEEPDPPPQIKYEKLKLGNVFEYLAGS